MDILDFKKTQNRMCSHYNDCPDCPFSIINYNCTNIFNIDNDGLLHVVKVLEDWAKEHPAPTRQSKFLQTWPNMYLDGNGIIDIYPCIIDKNYRDENGACAMPEINCLECKRDFWLKEVDDDE